VKTCLLTSFWNSFWNELLGELLDKLLDFWNSFWISDFWFLISDFWQLLERASGQASWFLEQLLDFWFLISDSFWNGLLDKLLDFWNGFWISDFWFLIFDFWQLLERASGRASGFLISDFRFLNSSGTASGRISGRASGHSSASGTASGTSFWISGTASGSLISDFWFLISEQLLNELASFATASWLILRQLLNRFCDNFWTGFADLETTSEQQLPWQPLNSEQLLRHSDGGSSFFIYLLFFAKLRALTVWCSA